MSVLVSPCLFVCLSVSVCVWVCVWVGVGGCELGVSGCGCVCAHACIDR